MTVTGVPVGTYELAGMRIEVKDDFKSVGHSTVIEVNPPLVSVSSGYVYGRAIQVWAICWDSAWAAVKLFYEANGLAAPERAMLEKS